MSNLLIYCCRKSVAHAVNSLRCNTISSAVDHSATTHTHSCQSLSARGLLIADVHDVGKTNVSAAVFYSDLQPIVTAVVRNSNASLPVFTCDTELRSRVRAAAWLCRRSAANYSNNVLTMEI